jgi:hypothetical protein
MNDKARELLEAARALLADEHEACPVAQEIDAFLSTPPLPDVYGMTVEECIEELQTRGHLRKIIFARFVFCYGPYEAVYPNTINGYQKAVSDVRQFLRPQAAPEPEKGESTPRDPLGQPTEIMDSCPCSVCPEMRKKYSDCACEEAGPIYCEQECIGCKWYVKGKCKPEGMPEKGER